MEKKLTIKKEQRSNLMFLKLAGRLDANWAGFLDDTLNELIQEGNYHVSLDLSEVVYLSSAGIRILVKQNKSFKTISGELSIDTMSENVRTVLDMVGMSNIFTPSKKNIAPTNTIKKELLKEKGYTFVPGSSETNQAVNIEFHGQPSKIKTCSFNERDNLKLKLADPFFGIGLGAIGEDFNDCQSRYGEFLALGNAVTYLPSDNTSSPDYMIKTGKLIPEINTLYYVGNRGAFSNKLVFSPDTESSIPISAIIEAGKKMGNHKNFSFLLIAESTGLIGSSLNVSPASNTNPFKFPEVREAINFTTEPSHSKCLTIACGMVFSETPTQVSDFVRPLNQQLQTHIHAAVFPYTPLKKEDIEYTQTIDEIFNHSEILDIMHLINDNREINGLGESHFKSGHLWTTEIKN